MLNSHVSATKQSICMLHLPHQVYQLLLEQDNFQTKYGKPQLTYITNNMNGWSKNREREQERKNSPRIAIAIWLTLGSPL